MGKSFACKYTNLSQQFDISIEKKVNATGNPDFDSTYLKVQIFEKGTDSVIQIVRKNHYWLWDDEFFDCNNARSYSTNVHRPGPIVDWDPGDIVVADLNFDGLDDFGFINDSGGNGGPYYLFYLQRENGSFYRNLYLCDSLGHFPEKFDSETKRITFTARVSCCSVCKIVYQYVPSGEFWFVKSKTYLGV